MPPLLSSKKGHGYPNFFQTIQSASTWASSSPFGLCLVEKALVVVQDKMGPQLANSRHKSTAASWLLVVVKNTMADGVSGGLAGLAGAVQISRQL